MGSITLSGQAPTGRIDGSPLRDLIDGSPLRDLAGYKIYHGRMSGTYGHHIDVNDPGIVTYFRENLVTGEWFISGLDNESEGTDSNRSNEVSKQMI